MSEAGYQTSLDAIWRKLRPHLELTEGFALAVLFTRHPAPVNALCKRLQEMLSINTLPLRKFVLGGAEQLESTLISVLTTRPLSGKRPPLWLEMWRDSGTEEQRKEQRRAVWQALSRLNERRFLLERDVACPLVLILPAELRMDVPGMAPDLWSVRSFTADLPTPAAVPQEPRGEAGNAPQTLRDLSISLNNVGGVDKELGRLEDARAAYAECREILAHLAKAFPGVPQYRKGLAYIDAQIAALF